MNRTQILLIQREKVMTNLTQNKENRAKWLAALMDIDDEMEEMKVADHSQEVSSGRTLWS